MNSRKNRLSELQKLPEFAALDHRLTLDQNGESSLTANLSRSERRQLKIKVKKIADEYKSILSELARTGAGFPTDQILRQMAIEYTNRYATSGIYNQPISFNYFEPFLNVRLIKSSLAPYTELTSEFNHLFYPSDFFDFITSSDSDGFDLKSLYDLAESKTFHFSTNGLVTDISFLNAENREFVISGFSMIRHGDSLYWYLIGGEMLDDDAWALLSCDKPETQLSNIPSFKRAFFSEVFKNTDPSLGAPIPLEGTVNAIRTIIAGEMDLREKKHLSRCYMSEYENAFPVFCDDYEVLSVIEDDQTRQDAMNIMLEKINNSAVLWNLAEGFFQLPSYFSARVAIQKDILDKSNKRLVKKKGGKGINKHYQMISSMEITNTKATSTIIKINLPHYEIETEGHWKRLKQNEIGRDRYGQEIIGKTWIKSSSNWRISKDSPQTIYVKDSIANAKLKISEYLAAAEKFEGNDSSGNNLEPGGELYVMRCSAMKETIFKVGYTEHDSIRRAEQLSSATGVPLSFVVVRSWKHINARALETEVHMMLAPYRINDGREFFLADFNTIEKVIEGTIKRVNSL